MNLLALFQRRATAPVARDRLQILLAHERSMTGRTDLVAVLREEILAVIAKHLAVDSEKVQVKMERGDVVSTLEVEIEIPTAIAPPAPARASAAAPAAA
ncbi:cell division topological specificity factor MinE [Faunimonas sp. B44]|uniref:cell division topological specificity factor MinE n=1 Tax=Faunimonas sp. B44 TaxID=3461493 RepID=UPI004044184C